MYRNLIKILKINILNNNFRQINICNCKLERLSLDVGSKSKGYENYKRFSNILSPNGLIKEKNENIFDIDDYITPNKDHKEGVKKNSKDNVINTLRYSFRVPEHQIVQLLDKAKNWEEINLVIDLLYKKGVHKNTILNNPWILKSSSKLLNAKFEILNQLTKIEINDFIPFFKHSVPRFQKLIKHLQCESKQIPGFQNRLYYISEKLNLEPFIVCNYISKRLFILEMPFDMLQENLNYMIEYGVAPLSILKDLWAFRYTPKSVKARLERAKDAKKDKIMPWMVRCPERVLQKSLKLSLDELNILGENNTVIDYISKRLDFDSEIIRVILIKHVQVLSVRVTKIKEILDYLLDEESFSKYSIAQVPRILCHGLETTKARMKELKSIGCRPSSLVILCKSRREYQKFVRKWLENQKRIEERTK